MLHGRIQKPLHARELDDCIELPANPVPIQADSEALVTYYIQNLHKLWEKKVVPELPPLQSILKSPSFQSDSEAVKIAEKWQPVAKTLAAKSVPLTAQLASIDGGTISARSRPDHT